MAKKRTRRKRHPHTGELVSAEVYEAAMAKIKDAEEKDKMARESERAARDEEKYLNPRKGETTASGLSKEDLDALVAVIKADLAAEAAEPVREQVAGPEPEYRDPPPIQRDRYRDERRSHLREVRDEHDRGQPITPGPFHETAPKSFDTKGCMIAVMFVAMLVLLGVTLWIATRAPVAPAPLPGPVPVVVPSQNLDALVAPIKTKLQYDPVKAEKVYKLHMGLSQALADVSGKRIDNTRTMNVAVTYLLEDARVAGGVSVDAEIEQAVGTHLGLSKGRDEGDTVDKWEFKSFTDTDRQKLVEITAAIAKAAGDTL